MRACSCAKGNSLVDLDGLELERDAELRVVDDAERATQLVRGQVEVRLREREGEIRQDRHTDRERERDRQTDRQIERERKRERDRN